MSKKYTNQQELQKDTKEAISDEYFSWLDLTTQINDSITDDGFFILIRDKIPLDYKNKQKAELLLALFKEILQFHKEQINPNAVKKSLGDYWPCFFIKHNNIGYIIGRLQTINEQPHIKIRRMSDSELSRIKSYKFIDIQQVQDFFNGKKDFQIEKIEDLSQSKRKLLIPNPKYKR